MEGFPRLNLPECGLTFKSTTGGRMRVYDSLRSRWVALTPEEYVRQYFVGYMVNVLGFSPHRLAIERGLVLNGTQRRFDALAYDDFGRPLVVVEFKAPNIALSQRTFDQIVRYNMVLRAPYLMVSNGLKHYCVHVDLSTGMYEFCAAMPHYDEIRRGK